MARIDSSWLRMIFRVGLVLALLVSLALVYMLVLAIDHRTLNDQNITVLLVINGLVAAVLLVSIAALAWRLRRRLKEGRFGSKLMMKLAAIFALVSLAPGILIYSVSYQFVSRSIESWFDVRVEGALEAGLNLGRQTLDNLSSDLVVRARTQVPNLDFSSSTQLALSLDQLRGQLRADDAQVWSQSGLLMASSGDSRFQLSPDKPTSAQMRALKTQRSLSVFEGLDDLTKSGTQLHAQVAKARLKVLLPVTSSELGLQAGTRYLWVSEKLPSTLVTNALMVQSAYSEYQERSLARVGLQKMYIGTLTLSLFLAVLGAFILAVLLGNQLMRPLLVLAAGMEGVSQGDLSPKLELHASDELAGLTRTFASMTQQLAEARVTEQKTERVKAWNEIAQRVAHEIKNPLTPIQLSAERIAMKLGHKLEGADAVLLHKSVKTIVEQVEAMKRLVNEFRDYARLPSANLRPISLLMVIQDTLHLYDNEIQENVIKLVVPLELLQDFPHILGDVEQLRQVIHNLLQNALDAASANTAVRQAPSRVVVTLSADSNTQMLRCVIEDNGCGFAPHILAHAFEPYNTTKPKGTGLGLAIVRKIIQEHRGDIVLSNNEDALMSGARVQLSIPLLKKGVGV